MEKIQMTREEAIGRILEHQRIHSIKEPFTPYLDEAFKMAIEALKGQEQLEKEKAFAEYLRERGY